MIYMRKDSQWVRLGTAIYVISVQIWDLIGLIQS